VTPGVSVNRSDRDGLPALTGLRFLAAMAVVISHFMERSVVPRQQAIFDLLDGGRTAVSLFFVLSGFVLAFNYPRLRDAAGRRRFYVARVARIYPVVLLSIAFSTVSVAYASQHAAQLLDWFAIRGATTPQLAASLVAQLTLTIGWFPLAAINQPWNPPAWSISCEVFFYALFPLLIAGLRNLGTRALTSMLLTAWAAQGALILTIRRLLPANRSGFLVSQFPVTHLFEFVLGIAVAVWFMRQNRQDLAKRRTIVLGLAVVGLVLLAVARPVRPVYFLMSPLFALLIVGLATPKLSGKSVLAVPTLLLLGEASYSLYLLHLPLVHIAEIFGVTGAAGLVVMVLSICVSVVVFRYFEMPLRSAIRARWSAPRVTSRALATPRESLL
jgi:peptidoglycan/LPS O-acetylase OafA/YrhL